MTGLKSARPVLGPLLSWSKAVIDESRKTNIDINETIECIKVYAKDRGWTVAQVNKALIYNGVRRNHPLSLICPKCEDVGRLNIFLNAGKISAVITHGKQLGYWGTVKEQRVRRRSRCFFYRITSEEKQRLLDQMYEKLNLIRRYG